MCKVLFTFFTNKFQGVNIITVPKICFKSKQGKLLISNMLA